jgi:hypothetical protein
MSPSPAASGRISHSGAWAKSQPVVLIAKVSTRAGFGFDFAGKNHET